MRPYYLYFIHRPEAHEVKIGISKDVACRLKTLQIGSGDPLVLLGTTLGGSDEEGFIHEVFAKHRKLGEWFRDEPELMAFISRAVGPLSELAKRGRTDSDRATRHICGLLDDLEAEEVIL